MSYFKYTSGLLLSVVLWAACKKGELPADIFGTPVFRVTYSLDDTGDSTVAGKNDRYLFTRYEESDFFVCSGAFAPVNCPGADCPGSLRFEFRSEITDAFEPESVFTLGDYSYLGTDSAVGSTFFRTIFTAKAGHGYSDFAWSIDSFYTGTGPTFQVDFPDEAPKFVELKASRPSGLQGTSGRTISLIDTAFNIFPDIAIYATFDSLSGIYQLSAESLGAPFDFLKWSNGDTSNTVQSDILDSSFSVVASGAGGAFAASATFENLSVQDLPAQTPGFDYTVENIFIPVPAGKVSIQWVDAQGQSWRSDGGMQSVDAFFTVLKSEPYDNNENGQKTRKMEVSFSCYLFNNDGEFRLFYGSGVIAVAHP